MGQRKPRSRVGKLMVLLNTKSSEGLGFPFRLKAFEEPLPAGSDDIVTKEKGVEHNERTVYPHVSTQMYLPTKARVVAVTIDSKDLQPPADADRIQSVLTSSDAVSLG